jgi:hypothetical protein
MRPVFIVSAFSQEIKNGGFYLAAWGPVLQNVFPLVKYKKFFYTMKEETLLVESIDVCILHIEITFSNSERV